MITRLFTRTMLFIVTGVLLLYTSMVVISSAQAAPIPSVWSVTLDTSAASQPGMLHFLVTFSENVTGVDTSDFSLSGDVGTAIITQVTPHTTTSYIVELTNTHDSRGLMLAVLDDDSIRNSAGMPLGGDGVSNGSFVSTAVVVMSPIQSTAPTSTPLPVVQPVSGGLDVGWYPSLALTTTNLPVISYYDKTKEDLRLAICDSLACTNPTIRILQSTFIVGEYTSLALTSTNNPVISFFNAFTNDLWLAICSNPTCTTHVLRQVDNSTGANGWNTSLALTKTNIPVISYVNDTTDTLKLAICNNPACTAPVIRTVAGTVGLVAGATSLALTSTNIPIISFNLFGNDPIQSTITLGVCNNPTCTSLALSSIANVDFNNGQDNDVVLTTNDIPIISFHDNNTNDLKLAVCDTLTCTTPTVRDIDTSGSVGKASSIKLTPNNVPVISYFDFTNQDLKLAICNNTDCTAPRLETLDSAGYVGSFTSLALMPSTHPLSITPIISYYDITNTSLKLYAGNHQLQLDTVVDKGLPLAFAKSLPANNAINQPVNVTLKWVPSSYAPDYEYCYATSIEACTTWTTTTLTQVTLSGLTKNTSYYWQVRAKNDAGTILATGGHWKFTTVK